MMRGLLGLLAPAGPNGRLSILIFHRVLPQPDPIFPDEMHAERFARLCEWLARSFHVLALDQAADRLVAGTLPARALCITFDDGYADNHDVALPILRLHGLSATFFVATGFLDGGRMWNDTLVEAVRGSPEGRLELGDLPRFPAPSGLPEMPALEGMSLASTEHRRQAIHRLIGVAKYLPLDEREIFARAVARASRARLPDDMMMRSDQVVALHRAGMTVGGHTVHHPILARLEPAEARHEIEAGKSALEALLQAPVTLFAYPNGKPAQDFRPEHAALVREAGFMFAVTTAPGAANAATDRFHLPRFTPWDRSHLRFGLRMARNLRLAAG
jgi:peptidoglycan/xylan/chitin deacetylase (PgdA/CDA1 family)